MFESHKKYFSSKRHYTKKKTNSYYSNGTSTKPRTRKRRGSLKEADDSFTYQTSPFTENHIETKNTNEVTEFLLEPEAEIEENKENISVFSNQPSSTKSSKKQSSNEDSPIINVSNETLQEAFYFPKKLTNMYNLMYNQYQMQYPLYNTPQQYPNNVTTSPPYIRQLSSRQSNVYDSPFSVKRAYTYPGRRYSGSNMNLSEKEKENTDILNISIKLPNKEVNVIKIRRYDDMFNTVKIFCEINQLESKYIRPLIIYIIKALNAIYGIVNLKLSQEEIKFLHNLRKSCI